MNVGPDAGPRTARRERSLVVVNPAASRLRDQRRRDAVTSRLVGVLSARDGVAPTVVETSRAGEAAPLVRAALVEGVASVVGVGGDGTLRELADVLRGGRVPMGIIPGGTGNLLGGILGVPGSLDDAVLALEGAVPMAVDLGLVEVTITEDPSGVPGTVAAEPAQPAELPTSGVFAIACSLGFDARVMASTPADAKRRFGRLAYFAQAAVLASRITAVPYRITLDGELIETEASVAMVLNMGQLVPGLLGPRMPIRHDDGLLDVIVVGARGPIGGAKALIDQLTRTRLGGGLDSGSLRLQGRTVAIEADIPEPIQVDGDPVGSGRLEATILPAALRVLVPGGTLSASPG